jgi:hypothetical protein
LHIDANKTIIAAKGGIPLVLESARTHFENADVARTACGALKNLAANGLS